MATDQKFIVSDIVKAALRKARITAIDEAPQAEDMVEGANALNRMLKGWQRKRWVSWTVSGMTVTLKANSQSYALGGGFGPGFGSGFSTSGKRPIRIMSARYVSAQGIETPMHRMTRQEYDDLPLKAAAGIPTTFYYDRQKDEGRMYVWPVLNAANGEKMVITYERELEDITDPSQELDMPVEWHECVIYGLASRMGEDYGLDNPKVDARSQVLLQEMLAEDREESVFFGEVA